MLYGHTNRTRHADASFILAYGQLVENVIAHTQCKYIFVDLWDCALHLCQSAPSDILSI